MTLGICMDLNPRPPSRWLSSHYGPYELAEHCQKHQSQLVILLNAWLHSGYDEISEDDLRTEADWQTVHYWANRLRPLFHRHGRTGNDGIVVYDDEDEDDPVVESKESDKSIHREEEHKPQETTFVVCNRTGTENGTVHISFFVLATFC